VGKSADNYITVTENGAIVSLGFSQTNGQPLPADAPSGGISSGLSTLAANGAISMYKDAVLGDRMMVGRDQNGQLVMAFFMDPTSTAVTAARVWTVQLQPLKNPDATNFDDPVTASNLGVSAGISTAFDFNTLPSGQNLFGLIG